MIITTIFLKTINKKTNENKYMKMLTMMFLDDAFMGNF